MCYICTMLEWEWEDDAEVLPGVVYNIVAFLSDMGFYYGGLLNAVTPTA